MYSPMKTAFRNNSLLEFSSSKHVRTGHDFPMQDITHPQSITKFKESSLLTTRSTLLYFMWMHHYKMKGFKDILRFIFRPNGFAQQMIWICDPVIPILQIKQRCQNDLIPMRHLWKFGRRKVFD